MAWVELPVALVVHGPDPTRGSLFAGVPGRSGFVSSLTPWHDESPGGTPTPLCIDDDGNDGGGAVPREGCCYLALDGAWICIVQRQIGKTTPWCTRTETRERGGGVRHDLRGSAMEMKKNKQAHPDPRGRGTNRTPTSDEAKLTETRTRIKVNERVKVLVADRAWCGQERSAAPILQWKGRDWSTGLEVPLHATSKGLPTGTEY
jgi:hypothetical protein